MMPNRILILVAVLFWYATVRMVIYHYFVPYVLHDGKHEDVDNFDWYFSWGVAVPITMLSIMFGALTFEFIWKGF